MERQTVFISATKEDLESYRAEARDAAIEAGFYPIMMEYFPASGHPSLQTCLKKVQSCDVLVAIVAHRYGWIPDVKSNRTKKSITWLECERAMKDKKEVLAFLIDDKYSWPQEKKENYRLTREMQNGTATPKLFEEVNTAIQKLNEFKAWLKQKTTIVYFTTEHNLAEAVLHALISWKERLVKRSTSPSAKRSQSQLEIPAAYREWLSRRCATVELLAHLLRQGCSPPRLSSVYVPAPTLRWSEQQKGKEMSLFDEEKIDFLLDCFDKESLYVPGLAGSGKSTFARWVAFLLCHGNMPEQIQLKDDQPLVEQFPRTMKDKLPLLIPFREFWHFLPANPGQRELSLKEVMSALEKWTMNKVEAIDWLTISHFLSDGKTVLLLDGIDEIPISVGESKSIYYPREMIITGLKNAIPDWLRVGNRILLTSRPYGLLDNDAQAMGLVRSEITELPIKLQHLFITRWFTALAYEPEMAVLMMNHLSEREELSPLTGNPVLLMAMCILFPEGKRLPQDKAELYQKTIERILFNRYGDSSEVEKVNLRLSVIAHGMHTGQGLGQIRKTPQAKITYDEIDRILTNYMEQRRYTEKGFTTVAEAREELLSRSGLLIQREQTAAVFYHLSFQEYLAGRRLVQLAGDNLEVAINEYANISEWRATLAFAFGTALQTAGSEKIIPILSQMIVSTSVDKLAHLVLTADFIEIIYRKDYGLEAKLESRFQNLCLEAIEKEVPLPERYDLGRMLGLVGDLRIELDLRQPSAAAYVLIPAGNYLIGEKKKSIKIKRAFMLSKYPVTNSQYRRFIDAGGYKDDDCWSKEGREWREENKITVPGYWYHGTWNAPNLPVVGVSYYEAEAFCRWVGGRLPTEIEWEAAARGRMGYEYPWGNKWEDGICNSHEAKLGKTSPVGLFPRSRSHDFGLEDIAGNVWEWCADLYDKKKKYRVLRGGAFDFDVDDLRCAVRGWNVPGNRGWFVGFRVVGGV